MIYGPAVTYISQQGCNGCDQCNGCKDDPDYTNGECGGCSWKDECEDITCHSTCAQCLSGCQGCGEFDVDIAKMLRDLNVTTTTLDNDGLYNFVDLDAILSDMDLGEESFIQFEVRVTSEDL